MATFWIYDYICSLHEEWTFLLRSRWTKVKALYITARYVPFLIITMNLYLAVAPNENTNKCQISIDIITSLSLILLSCSECFFVLRTHALWNNNRILLVVMLSTLFAIIVSSFIIGFTATVTSYSTSWRSAKGPLDAILVKHNIFYYACGLLLSVVNVVVPLLPVFDSLSYFLPEGFKLFILAILATRMHLHLWHMDQHVEDSGLVVWILMSDMSPADCTV
ncbi:hypothetical protein DFJ58DRAFT_155941 [Suillus subalutaceus]|uniref:uncharacterized protein n=1 Tax=Suillus subalutaceus TaxID=48586 RepID=UPI001B863240|nr:uncharacterized protein DFJ58DRAFT_155941 [Suillus subalutaceus]KAG1837104.1 hypothetical protein DFJ58DRAFT_155941 [Suillus subalutaceus]